jgi:glutathionyl-hydroquinone reductase
MSNLVNKIIAYLNRKPDFTSEVILQNDTGTDYIKEWNVDEAQPTEAQLNALESQADDMETLNQVYANRQAEYPSVQDLVVALYDTDDKTAIDEKRAEIKLKYPKPGA